MKCNTAHLTLQLAILKRCTSFLNLSDLEQQVTVIKGEKQAQDMKQFDSNASADERKQSRQQNKRGQFTELSQPQMILGSESGIGITARESIHVASSEQVAITSLPMLMDILKS